MLIYEGQGDRLLLRHLGDEADRARTGAQVCVNKYSQTVNMLIYEGQGARLLLRHLGDEAHGARTGAQAYV